MYDKCRRVLPDFRPRSQALAQGHEPAMASVEPPGSVADLAEGGGEEETAETASAPPPADLVKVRFDLTKPCKCCLCNSLSTSPSPLSSASDLDKYQGRRPWNKYKKVCHETVVYRVAEGRLCLICFNVYRAKGLHHRHGSYADYYKFISDKANIQEHQKFMAALQEWIQQHNASPDRARLRDAAAVRKAKPKMEAKQRTGLMIEAPEREFVTAAEWDPAVDGEWDDAKVETLVVAGKEERGIYKAPQRKGRYKVREYVDNSVDESRQLQGSDTPFTEQAMQEARDAVNQRWHSGRAERDKASVQAASSSPVSAWKRF